MVIRQQSHTFTTVNRILKQSATELLYDVHWYSYAYASIIFTVYPT